MICAGGKGSDHPTGQELLALLLSLLVPETASTLPSGLPGTQEDASL